MPEAIINSVTERLREELVRSTKVICEQKGDRLIGTVKIDDSIVTAINEATDELKLLVE